MSLSNIIAIGISTGGPRTLRRLFTDMPRLKSSVLLVQHMPEFINKSFCETMDGHTDMDVKLAAHGDRLEDGHFHVAPSDVHMRVLNNQMIEFVQGPKVCFVRPSVDVMMTSIKADKNREIIGIILTGLGRDGADGISHIKKVGGQTIAQDQDSCVIYGMPSAAAQTGNVDMVLNPTKIKSRLIELVGVMG